MAIITKPNSFVNNTVADAAAVNADFDTIFNDYNGNITDANIANTGITTYGKVQGAALTALAGINAGAGVIPAANIPNPLNQNTSGTAAGLSATLAIGSGGTGQTTAQAAVDALLPAQSSANGKYLTTNGSASSWGTITQYSPLFKSGTGSITNASSPVTITGVGFQPSAIFIFSSEPGGISCWGAWDGSGQHSASDSGTINNSYIAILEDGNPSTFKVSSVNSDGFVLTKGVITGTITFVYFCIK